MQLTSRKQKQTTMSRTMMLARILKMNDWIKLSLTKKNKLMKQIAALVISLSFGLVTLNAQRNEVTNTWSSLNSYQKDGDVEYLNRAKVAIDKATVHPDTK